MLPRRPQGFEAGRQVVFGLFLGLVFSLSEAVRAQSVDDTRYQISVVTLGPARSLFTRFGHTAIWVSDQHTDIQKLYNFGEFDYAQEGLIKKFLAGDLQYSVSTGSFNSLKAILQKSSRSLTVQTLALTPKEKSTLLELLDRAVQPENRHYQYHHYTANCCTKVRDAVNQATFGLLKEFHAEPAETYRRWTNRSLDTAPLLQLFFQLILNHEVDRPVTAFDAQYLPLNFSKSLDETRRPDGRLLAAQKQQIFADRYGSDASLAIQWTIIALFIALLTGLLAAPLSMRNQRLSHGLFGAGLALFGLTSGAAGVLMLFLWCFTPYLDLHANENLLLFLPTHLLLAACGIFIMWNKSITRRIGRFVRGYLIIAAFCALCDLLLKLGPFYQDNYIFICAALGYFGLIGLSVKKSDTSRA